jgi:hypothetical protein
MSIVRITALVMTSIAVAAFATAASAAEVLWKLLPGSKGATFTGKSGKATFQIKGGSSLTCPSSTSTSGEVTEEQTLELEVVEYIKCTFGGLPVNSLGDASGVVLIHYELHNCTISAGLSGWLRKMLPLHLEIPSTKLLITEEGSDIGQFTPNKKASKTFSLIVEQKEGKQSIEKCEGGTAQTRSTSLDGGAFVQSSIEEKESTLTFASEQEAMA